MNIDATTDYNYAPPVDKLLTFGDARHNVTDQWSYYLELGFGPEHIPELVRMATDERLNTAETESTEVWAPLHALRVLGQLRNEAAIEPLLTLFETTSDDEWMNEELPDVYGMIGPAALPALAAYVTDDSHKEFARITAIASIEKMAKDWPDVRDECVALLMQQLEHFTENGSVINAFLILSLIELRAKEAASLIERAYAANSVEVEEVGDWDDVQVELGLKPHDEAKLRRLVSNVEKIASSTRQSGMFQNTSVETPLKNRSDKVAHKKVKNKLAKQSRKKNRKR